MAITACDITKLCLLLPLNSTNIGRPLSVVHRCASVHSTTAEIIHNRCTYFCLPRLNIPNPNPITSGPIYIYMCYREKLHP